MGSSADPVAASAIERDGSFPGWWVVAGCFVVLAVSSGLGFYGLAVYLNAFSNEKGWPLSSISLATTVFFVVGGVAGVVVARVIARHDVRIVIVVGGVVGGLALGVLGQVEQQWQLFVVYSVFAAGWAAAGLVPVTTVVTRWFHTRRSVALSVASTGLSAGGILLTPFAKRLLDDRGLAAGTPWLGAVFVVGIVPIAWFLVRPDPEAEGWAPDGARRAVGEVPPAPGGTPFAEAVRSRFFVAVTIGFVLAFGAQVGGIQQLVKLVEDRTDAGTAQFAITAVAATSIVARLIGGRVVQFVPMMRLAVVLVATQAVALVVIGAAESTWLLFLAIIVFGATVGNVLMLQPLLIAERFGVRDYPRIFSRTQLYAVIGTAGGPLLLGALYDLSDGYRLPYAIAGTCSLIGAAALAFGGPATVEAAPPPAGPAPDSATASATDGQASTRMS
jgi:MFS family permease